MLNDKPRFYAADSVAMLLSALCVVLTLAMMGELLSMGNQVVSEQDRARQRRHKMGVAVLMLFNLLTFAGTIILTLEEAKRGGDTPRATR